MSQSSHPTLINMPQPPSRPDTPSEAPGTPTSTTTSLSGLSTTAIKDGHRGQPHGHPATTFRAGHQHTHSSTSLEAERADRISRLTGMSNISALRNAPIYPYSNAGFVPQHTPPYSGPYQPTHQHPYHPHHHAAAHHHPGGPHMLNGINLLNPQPPLTPAYFDPAGQPVAAPTKLSTVGSASATESVAGRTNSPSPSSPFYDGSASSTRRDADEEEDDDDVAMRDEDDGGGGYGEDGMLSDRDDGEDMDDDDGSASLVGFGEGAGSTVSGPIYQRRQQRVVGEGSAASAMASWGRGERAGSGLGQQGSALRMGVGTAGEGGSVAGSEGGRGGGETPVSQAALQERRDAALVDGVALGGAGDDGFVDTSTRGPVPMVPVLHQANVSAIRETQQPGSHQQQQQQWRSAAERIVGERLDDGEGRPGVPALGRASAAAGEGGQRLGQFYFEEGRR